MRKMRFDQYKAPSGKSYLMARREGIGVDYNSIYSSLVEDEYGLMDPRYQFADDDVIIDLGAYLGSEVALFHSINPNMNIYSYEALPENASAVQMSITKNNINKAKISNKAAGEKDGMLRVYYGVNATTENAKDVAEYEFMGIAQEIGENDNRRFVDVPMVSLATIFNENRITHCKVLKMDIEGSEVSVLSGCSVDLLDKIDWIIGEHHGISRLGLLQLTHGLFTDEPCKNQSDVHNIGHFMFKNKKLTQGETK